MAAQFAGYPDLLNVAHGSTATEDSAYQQLADKFRKLKKKHKKLKQEVAKQTEAKPNEELTQNVASFFSKAYGFIKKVVAGAITLAVTYFVKGLFSRKDKDKVKDK